jgi:hypothetical protein
MWIVRGRVHTTVGPECAAYFSFLLLRWWLRSWPARFGCLPQLVDQGRVRVLWRTTKKGEDRFGLQLGMDLRAAVSPAACRSATTQLVRHMPDAQGFLRQLVAWVPC